jgi:ABC-type multidrug transport system permease subunit
MWRQAALIAAKDVRVLLADKSAIMFMMVFPLILVAVMSTVMAPSYTAQDSQMEIVMVTHEGAGSISQGIIDGMQETAAKLAVVQALPEVARQAVEERRLGGYIEFPAGFSQALLRGEPVELFVFAHPEAQTMKPALESVARAVASEITRKWVEAQATATLALRYGGEEIHARLAELLAGGTTGGSLSDSGDIAVEFVQVGPAESKSVATHMLPGYVTMFIFFGLALTAEVLVGERENQTLDRLIASRATRGSILLGKYLGNVARGTIQAMVLFGTGYFLFDLDLGYTPWAIFAVTLAVVLCAAALGLAMATIARTRRAASAIAVLASMVMAPLGGCWWPIWIMPFWMQTVAKFTPHAWANIAYSKLLYFASPPSAVFGEIAVLLLFAAGFGAFAAAKFRIEQ